jgi:hypothetical protein
MLGLLLQVLRLLARGGKARRNGLAQFFACRALSTVSAPRSSWFERLEASQLELIAKALDRVKPVPKADAFVS